MNATQNLAALASGIRDLPLLDSGAKLYSEEESKIVSGKSVRKNIIDELHRR